KPRKGTIARGRLIERHGAPGLDVIVGEATSTTYDAVHTRRGAFVSDEYWVIEDRLAGRTPHRYDLRFHLAPDAQGRVAVERPGGSAGVRAPGLALASVRGSGVRGRVCALVIVGDAAPVVEPGWISPDYGIRHAAPVVSIVADGAADATFTTLVLPLPDGAAVAGVAPRSREEPTALAVTGERFADTICWSRDGFPLDLGPLR